MADLTKKIVYSTPGGFTSEYSPKEIGLATSDGIADQESAVIKRLLYEEQERAVIERRSNRYGRKAAPPVSGVSVTVGDDGTLYLNFGQNNIMVNPEDVDKLAQACAQAIFKRNAKSHLTYTRNQSIF